MIRKEPSLGITFLLQKTCSVENVNPHTVLSHYHSLLTGSVAVYSACDKQAKPLYCSTAKTGKHTDPVWEVRLETRLSNFHLYRLNFDLSKKDENYISTQLERES